MVDIHLEPDEAVVLREEGVKYSKDPNDTRIGFSNKGELILTNHNIIFAYATGMLKKQIHEQRIPLEAVKVFNGTAQIKASKTKTGSMDYRLTVYAEDGTSLFLFPQELKRKLKDWVESINELIVGHRTGFEAADIGDMDMGKLVSHALHTAQPIVQGVADLAAPIAPLVGAAVGNGAASTPMGQLASTVLGKLSKHEDADTHQEDIPDSHQMSTPKSSLDEQMEGIKKLKDLLDAGILSQEEFNAKKRQILGI